MSSVAPLRRRLAARRDSWMCSANSALHDHVIPRHSRPGSRTTPRHTRAVRMAVGKLRSPSRPPCSLWQGPMSTCSPRIARLSPGPRRVGPPCARERRVAGSTTRTAGSSRSRGEGRKCADAGKVLAAADLGTASPSASLEVTSVPTTPVMWWPEAVRLLAVLVVSLWALHLSTLCVAVTDVAEPTAVGIRLDVPELDRAVVVRRPSHSVVRSRWGTGNDRLCRREQSPVTTVSR